MIEPIILAIVSLANGKQNCKAEYNYIKRSTITLSLAMVDLIWKISGTKNIAQRIEGAMKVAC
jgi:hypothetical protein